MKKIIFAFTVFLSFFLNADWISAATYNVPGDYASIQAAINAASSNDTIYVHDGYYYEHITLKSGVNVIGEGTSTRINGSHTGSVVTAVDVTNAKFSGFWIYYSGTTSSDAGIKISGGSLTVSNVRVSHCANGIYIYGGSSAMITNNVVQYNGDNDNLFLNYGIICLKSTPLISNNLIRANDACGMYIGWIESDGAQIINNTIADNSDFGIWCYISSPTIKNNISTGNTTGISASHDAHPTISYNDVWNNSWHDYDSQSGGVAAAGPGDISVDPLFNSVNPSKYYLTEESPCIDSGDPNPLYNDIDGTRNDMGVWGGPFGANSSPESLTSGFLFTSIGKIPTSEITQTIGSHRGLANVSAAVHYDLGIHQYTDSPFGGRLWLHGLFGSDDDNIVYYKILVAKWTTLKPPPSSAFVPLVDPLTKIKYTINTDGTVDSERVTLGPLSAYGHEALYQRTNTGYWAHRDLKMIWNTSWMANGTYDIMYKAYKRTGSFPFYSLTEVVLPYNDFERITVVINNSPVKAEIHSVNYDAGAPITECGIIDLENESENLKFYITASHPEGYLLSYNLDALYGKNHNAGIIASDNYDDVAGITPPQWYGISNLLVNSADAMASGDLAPWTACAHQFRLKVWARTTNGYNYIKYAEFNDHYFIQINACAADLNNDGVVDGSDLAEFAASYGRADCF